MKLHGPLLAAATVVGAFSGAARAEMSVRTLARATDHVPIPARSAFDPRTVSSIVEFPEGVDGAAWGMARVGGRFSTKRASLAELDALAALHPDWRITWSPPLHPLLDRAAGWARAPSYRNDTGRSGKGVVVGVVDTGIDPRHADFQNPDGTTRIAYLLDFAADGFNYPRSRPEVDPRIIAQDACVTAGLKCAVYAAADIDAANAAKPATVLPTDTVGHGTHVASLAAGNGGKDSKYVGIAPEATLVIARAIDSENGVGDDAVLTATSLVFTLAELEGKKVGLDRLPAVVNLSLGSDWGPHDGSTALERGLSDLVGDAHPGRAIVVAAGNSAGLYTGAKSFPNPLGIHTDVNVPEGEPVRVPLVLPPMSSPTAATRDGTVFVWLAFRPEDDLSLGVDRNGATWVPVMRRGRHDTFGSATLAVTVVNGALDALPLDLAPANAGAVAIQGTIPRSDTFQLELVGHGTASIWVQAEGELAFGVGTLLPGATKEGTVTIPAASASLIAVGATLNRTSWVDEAGDEQHVQAFGSVKSPLVDSIAYFSSAGPTSDLRMKPDLVAAGGFVAGALSAAADPAVSSRGIFAESNFCNPSGECVVVDATHAVTLGTSMAAPLVAGAVALLLEGDPTLTEDRIRTLLQAGARRLEGGAPPGAQLGPGALDLEGVRDVTELAAHPVERTAAKSETFLTLGSLYARPDPTYGVPATLSVRDAAGHAVIVDAARLSVRVDQGHVVGDVDTSAPGLVRFAVAADRETGGSTLTVEARYDGDVLAESTLPIAVDINVTRSGFAARGGCTVAAGRASSPLAALLTAALIGLSTRARRRRRAARTARNPGRTGT